MHKIPPFKIFSGSTKYSPYQKARRYSNFNHCTTGQCWLKYCLISIFFFTYTKWQIYMCLGSLDVDGLGDHLFVILILNYFSMDIYSARILDIHWSTKVKNLISPHPKCIKYTSSSALPVGGCSIASF